MEILNSGSFITLAGREKIEQLIFTAKELAKAASQSEGFVNAGPSNQSLALEMWQGTEYMCRAHEEATIKNIFLSNFLQNLRDIGMQKPFHQVIAETKPAERNPAVPVESEPQRDEYLGVVASDSHDNYEPATRPSYADECIPEAEADIVQPGSELEPTVYEPDAVSEAVETISDAAPDPPVANADSQASSAPITTESIISEPTVSESVIIAPPVYSPEIGGLVASSVEAIVLQEKEPYQFDACTVTTVIQLLPEQAGVRKCVVSVRTHDFSPQVVVGELRSTDLIHDLPAALGRAFEQYKVDLPVRAADKMKKEKVGAKKRPAKASASTAAKEITKETSAGESSVVPAAKAAMASADQASLFNS